MDAGANPNNVSYWYPKIENIGFKTPKTEIVKISIKDFEWLISDNYKPAKINEFSAALLSEVSSKMKAIKKKFIKTGNYSGKFNFNENCLLIDNEKIGKQYLDIFYDAMLVGCDDSNECVIREFIETSYHRSNIYNGMKLNTEFRLFYDFDNNDVLGVFNYWDRKTMLEGIHSPEDKDIFLNEIDAIEKDFEIYKKDLEAHCINNLKKVEGLTGIWSVDFLYDGNDFVLIDMGLGQQSYYFDKLNL